MENQREHDCAGIPGRALQTSRESRCQPEEGLTVRVDRKAHTQEEFRR